MFDNHFYLRVTQTEKSKHIVTAGCDGAAPDATIRWMCEKTLVGCQRAYADGKASNQGNQYDTVY